MFGLVLLLMFVWWELRVSSPFIDIRLLIARQTLTSVYAQFIMLNIFNYCLFFGLPSYFQDEMHLSVQASGLLMLFMSGTSVLISPFVGRWIDRSGETQPVFIGSCIMAAGAILLTLFFVDAPMLWKGIILSLLGVSYGLGKSRPAGCHVYGKSAGHRRDHFGALPNMPLSWLDLFVRHSGSVVWRRNNRGSFSGSGGGHDCGCHRAAF
jgi:MFS family permease